MNIEPLKIPGTFVIEPEIFRDHRGYFLETFNSAKFPSEAGAVVNFVQDNESESKKSVVRGFHFQRPPFAQAKLVRVNRGSILDVVIDLRKQSKTYKEILVIELNSKRKNQLFIPRGCAHGFYVKSDRAQVSYKADNFYAPQAEGGVSIHEEKLRSILGDLDGKFELSAKDQLWPAIDHYESDFD